jgi:hypothetical protein
MRMQADEELRFAQGGPNEGFGPRRAARARARTRAELVEATGVSRSAVAYRSAEGPRRPRYPVTGWFLSLATRMAVILMSLTLACRRP